MLNSEHAGMFQNSYPYFIQLTRIKQKIWKVNLRILKIVDNCECIKKDNQFGEGAICSQYSGYVDDWYNGVWCYANISSCKDATEHPADEDGLKGIGASKIACQPGNVVGKTNSNCILYIYILSFQIMISI